MILTHRRRNLCEAYLISDGEWVTMEQLKTAGAYGSSQSIHRAMRKLMLKEEAAMIARIGPATHYKITHTGIIKFGHVPAKRNNDT